MVLHVFAILMSDSVTGRRLRGSAYGPAFEECVRVDKGTAMIPFDYSRMDAREIL